MAKKFTISESDESYEIGDILDFDELNEAQKQYVVNHIDRMPDLYSILSQWYDDELMDLYQYDLTDLTDEYKQRLGLSIKSDRLYWQSSSQGPYPDWDLESVLDNATIDTENGGNVYIVFYGSSTDVHTYITVEWINADGYYESEEDLEVEDLHNPDYNLTDADIAKIEAVIDGAQEYIDNVWRLVHDVCTSYPDNDWLYNTMEANEMGGFEVVSDTEVRYVE